MMRAARALKIARDSHKQKLYRLNRPLRILGNSEREIDLVMFVGKEIERRETVKLREHKPY